MCYCVIRKAWRFAMDGFSPKAGHRGYHQDVGVAVDCQTAHQKSLLVFHHGYPLYIYMNMCVYINISINIIISIYNL